MKLGYIAAIVILGFILSASIAMAGPGDKGHDHVEDFIKGTNLHNGRSIYERGITATGAPVPRREGPPWITMHGGGCLACHGEYGKGDVFPHMCDTKAPAVTYESLVEEEHGHASSGVSYTEKEEHEPYTIERIKTAIVQGTNPAGKSLNICMPRWELKDKDLKDLLAYLIKLDDLKSGH